MKKSVFHLGIIIALLISVFTSCKKDSVLLPEDLGYNYFPAEKGLYWIYSIDSTYYNDFTGQTEHYIFQIRDQITNEFTDNSGRKSFIVSRSYRLKDTMSWSFVKLYYFTPTSTGVELVLDNIRYLKLCFPVSPGISWDINAFNTLGPDKVEFTDVDIQYMVGNKSFDSTAVVLQENLTTVIGKEEKYEVYSRKVGMVYKKFKDIQFNLTNQTIKSGVDYSYTLLDWGKM